jgi:hydrogenase maturation protease
MSARVLAAGIGNIFFGDDAFGSEVARRLQQEQLPDDVRVVDFGIRGLDLMYALLDGYETVVLIDATPRGGSPGTLYVLEPELGEEGVASVEAHSMDPMRVLAAAKSMGATWKRLLVLGCEPSPDSADPDGPGAMGMSESVTDAVEVAIPMVRRILCESTLANSLD